MVRRVRWKQIMKILKILQRSVPVQFRRDDVQNVLVRRKNRVDTRCRLIGQRLFVDNFDLIGFAVNFAEEKIRTGMFVDGQNGLSRSCLIVATDVNLSV